MHNNDITLNTGPWPIDLADLIPKGEKLNHFRTVGDREKAQHKIFYAGNRVITVEFRNGDYIQTTSKVRRRNESLLGLEGSIEEQLRKEGLL
jgi:hypothetical protein